MECLIEENYSCNIHIYIWGVTEFVTGAEMFMQYMNQVWSWGKGNDPNPWSGVQGFKYMNPHPYPQVPLPSTPQGSQNPCHSLGGPKSLNYKPNGEMTIYCFDKQRSQASWSSTWSRFACCSGFRSKARNKIPRLLNLDSDEVCDLRLQIETSNNRKFH